VQTLGVVIILPLLVAAAIAALFILGDGVITTIWDQIEGLIVSHVPEVVALSWGLIRTVLVLVLGLGFARTLMRVAIRGLGENRIDINFRTLIGRIFYIITVIIVIFWILAIWNVGIELPVALIGTFTVAFTFAIQDILKDLVAGFYILMERPFHIGDLITIGNITTPQTGIVEDVQIRATRLRLTNGEQATVPNALIFGGVVVNNYSKQRASITVTLPQEEFSKDETANRIIKALKEIPSLMVEPEPTVMINGYSGKLLTLIVRFWIASGQLAPVSEVMYTLRTALPNADLAVLESAGNV
jgi:small-conductance mechanosensitive channel